MLSLTPGLRVICTLSPPYQVGRDFDPHGSLVQVSEHGLDGVLLLVVLDYDAPWLRYRKGARIDAYAPVQFPTLFLHRPHEAFYRFVTDFEILIWTCRPGAREGSRQPPYRVLIENVVLGLQGGDVHAHDPLGG